MCLNLLLDKLISLKWEKFPISSPISSSSFSTIDKVVKAYDNPSVNFKIN